MNDDISLYDVYILVDDIYRKKFMNLGEEKIYPKNWYSINSYKLKIDIMTEAIDRNVLILETNKYKNYMKV